MRDAHLVVLRAVASAVFIGTGCTSGSTIASEAAPQAPSSVLADADVTLVARLLDVADTRQVDTVFVDQALSSRVSYVRALGVRVIGQNAIAARARVLPTLMFEADTAVAAEAAFALGQLRYGESLAHLANALGQSPSVAGAAAWSIGEIGGTAGRGILEHALTTGEPRAALVAVLESAAKLRPVPSQLITPYLTDSNAHVQRAAAYAVTRSRVPGSVRALIDFANRAYRPPEVAEDLVIDLWSYVGRGLGQPAAGDSLGQAAQGVLVRLAVDPHPRVRINALRALATYGRDARAFFLTRGRDPDANTRIAWAQALGDVAGRSVDDWMVAWRVDTGFTFRRSLLTPALRAGVRLPALDGATPGRWTRHANWRYRAAAAQAAAAGSAADIDALAVPLLHDSDARVRSSAWASALAWADSAAALGKPYARASVAVPLGDAGLFVRSSVLDAMRGRARARDAAIAVRAGPLRLATRRTMRA